MAEALGAADARPYAAAALLQLGRPEDAVEAFADAAREGRDALLDYHHAVACHEARLYACADRLLASIGPRVGPRLAEQAGRIRASLVPLLSTEPPSSSIDWYLRRCAERQAEGRPTLALAYCHEALDLAARRGDQHRRAEAAAQVDELARATARAVKR